MHYHACQYASPSNRETSKSEFREEMCCMLSWACVLNAGQQYEQEVWAEGPRLQGYIWGTPNTGTLCMLAALRSAGALLRYSKVLQFKNHLLSNITCGELAPLQQHDSLGTHARTRLSLQGGFDLKGLP